MRLLTTYQILGYFLFLKVFTSYAGDPADAERQVLKLSLMDAREYAVEHSYTIRKAKADLRIAEQQIWETTAIGLPQISASVGYNYFIDIPTSLVPAEFFGGTPGDFEEIQFGTPHSLTATASIEQLLFDGQYIVGLRASRIFRNLAGENLERSRLDIRNTVTETYILVLLARENLKITRQNLVNMQKMLDETRILLEEGFTDPINVDQLQLTVSNIENNIASLQRQEKMVTNLLKFQTGIDQATHIELTDQLETLHDRLLGEISLDPGFDLENHIEYRITRSREEMSLMVLRREQTAYLPSLTASFVRQEMAMRNEFSFFESDRSWFPSTYFAVNLNIPIFSSGMRSSMVQQARLELEKARLEREEVSEALMLRMDDALADFRTARETFLNAQENKTLAERIFHRTSIMFREGMATSLELTQANDQLLTTQANYYQSMFELLNATNNVERALGR
ncbi:MAG: TolC family protein [Bacteroidia bacterium]|nr:MAG: TolC family protein [Bacteroidia bacterium]